MSASSDKGDGQLQTESKKEYQIKERLFIELPNSSP